MPDNPLAYADPAWQDNPLAARPVWAANNPVGTQYAGASMGMPSVGGFDPIVGMTPQGPMMQSQLDAAHQQVAQAMDTAPMMALGMTGEAPVGLGAISQKWNERGIDHHISEHEGTITVGKIVVPPDQRGKGIGTEAMQELTDYADANGSRIVLTPSTDFGGSSVSRLTRFYRGLGFSPNKGRSRDFTTRETMIRNPVSVGEE